MRDEYLNKHLFFSMNHARALIAGWVENHNTARPHWSIGYMKPQRAPALRHPDNFPRRCTLLPPRSRAILSLGFQCPE
jgi:transposase InsO family protein